MSRLVIITSGLLKATRSQPAHVYVKPLLTSVSKCVTCESPCAQEKNVECDVNASINEVKTQEATISSKTQIDKEKDVQDLEKNSQAAEVQMTTYSTFDRCASRIVPSDILHSGIAVPAPAAELRAAAIATVGAPLVSTPTHTSIPAAASVTLPSPAAVPTAPHVPWPYRLPTALRPRAGTTFHDNYVATPSGAAHFSSAQSQDSSSASEKPAKVSTIQKIPYGVPDPEGTPTPTPNGDAEDAEKETGKGLWQEMVDGVRHGELEMEKVARSDEAMRNKRWAPSATLALKYEHLGEHIADLI